MNRIKKAEYIRIPEVRLNAPTTEGLPNRAKSPLESTVLVGVGDGMELETVDMDLLVVVAVVVVVVVVVGLVVFEGFVSEVVVAVGCMV